MGIGLTSGRFSAEQGNSVEQRKRDKLTGIVRNVAIVDTALAVFQVLYAQFRLLRPDHPLRRDVFTQFMDQSFIFPVILFAVVTLHGILAIRLYFAAKMAHLSTETESVLKRCRWWCHGSVLFIILSFLDLYVIIFLLAFDAYRRLITIIVMTILRLTDITFRIIGIHFVRQLKHLLENPRTASVSYLHPFPGLNSAEGGSRSNILRGPRVSSHVPTEWPVAETIVETDEDQKLLSGAGRGRGRGKGGGDCCSEVVAPLRSNLQVGPIYENIPVKFP